MSGLNCLKLGSTLSNICNTTQLDSATECHYAFKNFWGEPWKAFGNNKKEVAQVMISIFDRVENFVGKGENAGKQHFLLFQKCFLLSSSS